MCKNKNKSIIFLCYLLVAIFALALFVCSTTARLIAAEDSPDNWEVTISGIDNIVYRTGDVIPINIKVHTHNPASCPNCLQQIVIGIVDKNLKGSQINCVLNEKAGVYPSGLGTNKDISLTIPSDEGIFTIIAAKDFQNNCDEAQKRFPNQTQTKIIKQFMVVDKSINISSVPQSSLPLINSFTANPSSVKKGESTRLTWDVLNATDILISPEPGRAYYKGGFTARYYETTTYTLAAKNSLGYIVGTTTVSVGEEPPLETPKDNSNTNIPKTSTPNSTSANQSQGFLNFILPLTIVLIIVFIIWRLIKRPSDKEGYIYIMRCSAYKKDWYKIGKSSNPEERAKQLSSATGVAREFEVLFKLRVDNAAMTESRVHKELQNYRVHDNREFFKGPIDAFIDIIKKNKS
jgi:hypothetical protein